MFEYGLPVREGLAAMAPAKRADLLRGLFGTDALSPQRGRFSTRAPQEVLDAVAPEAPHLKDQAPASTDAEQAGFHPLARLGDALGMHPLRALSERVRQAVGSTPAAQSQQPPVSAGPGPDGRAVFGWGWWDAADSVLNGKAAPDPLRGLHEPSHPAVMARHRGVPDQYYCCDEHAELWPTSGPNMREVLQGQAGDCYFLAALASAIRSGKVKLDEVLKPVAGRDNVYQVTFYKPDPKSSTGWSPVDEPIEVDGCLPHDSSGRHLYARAADTVDDGLIEDGIAILEKAAAVYNEKYHAFDAHLSEHLRQGYDGIGNGGWPADAISALTGQATQSAWLRETPRERVEAMLRAANEPGRLVVAGSLLDRTPPAPIVGGHAYTVVGVDKDESGKEMVVLRNPWGVVQAAPMDSRDVFPSLDRAFDPDPGIDSLSARENIQATVDARDAGQFTISMEDFMKAFSLVSMNTPDPVQAMVPTERAIFY